jgi:hypothetical protein
VFLKTESIAVLASDAQRTLDAFRAAGVQVFTVTAEEMRRGLSVFSRLPMTIRGAMKAVAKVTHRRRWVHLILIAGGAALAFAPVAGIPAAIGTACVEGNAVMVGDP